MSAADYLWPARPEYLRRGSVVVPHGEGLVAVVIEIDGDDLLLIGQLGGKGWKVAHAVALDLRDVTARAHAAMAYTAMAGPARFFVAWGVEPCEAMLDGDGCGPMLVLCRMRALDESVTVAEAREALGWAERVKGVAS